MSNGSEKSAAHGRLQKYFLLTSKEAYEAKAKNIQEKVYKEQEKEKRKLERIEKQKQKAVLQHQKQMKNKNNGKQQKLISPVLFMKTLQTAIKTVPTIKLNMALQMMKKLKRNG